MSIGLLIITHTKISQELVATAASILGNRSLAIHTMPIPTKLEASELGAYADLIRNAIFGFNSADGVLILTDIYGATPNNLSR